MQTFLPYPDFELSAKCLDYRRLGKQRVEVLQLLTALVCGPIQYFDTDIENWVSGSSLSDEEKTKMKSRATPWYNHPAAKMWRGYEQALVHYGFAVIEEWVDRGYKDTCHDKICETVAEISFDWDPETVILPPWLGDEDFHAAHRSNLLRKDPVHYGQFGWTESNDLPYIWPTL